MDQSAVRKGLTVRDQAGNKLGEVVACGQSSFVIGTGVPASPELAVRHSDIVEARDGEIVVGRSADEIRRREEREGPATPTWQR